jgi:hypothetical protein
MAGTNKGQPHDALPTKKDKKRPWELLIFAAILGVFTGLVVFMSTRQLITSVEFAGAIFIVSLVALAMFALAVKPKDAEQADLDEQNRGEQNRGEQGDAPDAPAPRGH